MQSNPLQAAHPQHNAVVKASAGVGKTYLLVTRLLRLLLAGAKPDAILAVTFTRKAAAEMQTRLLERLYQLCAADETELGGLLRDIGENDDPTTRQRARQLFEQLLRHPATVKTTTFHAFCQDILRRFPLEADVPPGFALLEKTSLLQQSAWEVLCNDAARDPDGQLAQALETLFNHCGSLASTREALDEFLNYRADWWAYVDGQEDAVLHASKQLQQQLKVDPDCDPRTPLFQPILLQQLAEFATLLAKHATKTNLDLAQPLADALAQSEQHDALFNATKNAFLTGAGKPRARKAGKTQNKALGDEGEQRLLQLHEEICALLDNIKQMQARQLTYQRSAAWYLAGNALLQHYQRLKQEQRQLDFGDLEWKAYQLLRDSDNAMWVQYKLDQRIDHLLVDEFQDTNPTQWRLLLPLLEEMAQGQREARSVFLVGDDKQSIYGFRRADPRLLDQAGYWLQQNLNARDYPMDKSRRSASSIMQVVNNTFSHEQLQTIMPNFAEHDTYQDLWGEAHLLPLARFEEQDEEEIVWELRNPLQQPRPEGEESSKEREAQKVALQIRQLIDQQTPIGSSDCARPCHYCDIMLLLRSRTHVHAFESALREQGIPYLGADRGTLLETREVQDMVALLEVLTVPFNNLALATCLKSPLFSCSDDDLILLAQCCPQHTSWMETLLDLERLPEKISPELNRARELLSQWHQLALHTPIHDLVDQIFHQGDVLARFQASNPSFLRQRAERNLSKFLQLALEVDSGRYPTSGRFLAALEEMRSSSDEAPDEANPGEGADAVRIMTIHGSKGLEAPVVFLADCARETNAKHANKALIHWPDKAAEDQSKPQHFFLLGKKDDQDPLSQQLLELHSQRNQQEDANLLYVAITRARQLLFISGSLGRRQKEIGWYGQLEQAWPRDEDDNPIVISNGRLPSLQPVASTATTKEEINLDWLRVSPAANDNDQEISPSQLQEQDSEWQGERNRQRGNAIHRYLQVLSEQPEIDLQQLQNQLAFEINISHQDELIEQALQEAQQTLQHPEMQPLFDQSQFIRAWNEVPIQFRVQRRHQHGIIDRLIETDKEMIICDYKTHRIQNSGQMEQIAQQYYAQLQAYAQGVKLLWPKKRLRAKLIFTHNNTIVPIPLEQN